MQQSQPTSFFRFLADTASNELLSFGVGVICASGYYLAARQRTSGKDLWLKTGTVYTLSSLATTGVRVLLSNSQEPSKS